MFDLKRPDIQQYYILAKGSIHILTIIIDRFLFIINQNFLGELEWHV